jgi:peptidoglycan hydrolase-like protein with peptidoglycan-binding domain
MKTRQIPYITGLLGLVIAFGMTLALVPPVSAISDSSDQSPPGKQHMQPSSSAEKPMQSMKAGDRDMGLQASQNDAPIHVGPAAVRKIQEQLSQKGFEVGTADGVWGSSTSSAVKEFQKSQGLASTGKLDLETIQAMNIQDLIGSDSDAQGIHAQKGKGSVQGAQLFISPSQLKRIQQGLKDQGYDVGSADGIWGSKTQHAVSTYQQDKGLTPTGGISIGMLEDMGMSESIAALGIGGGSIAQQPADDQAEARGYFGGEQQADRAEQAQGTGAPLYAGSDMIQQVQQSLKDNGQDPGQADGIWTAQTAQAVEEFQQSENLAPTGTLTVATIHKLIDGGLDDATSGQPSSQPMFPKMHSGPRDPMEDSPGGIPDMNDEGRK